MATEYKTTAVVLHSIAHGEKGHIAYLFTRESGRVAYYIFSAKNGVAQVGSNKISLQPLSLLNIIGTPSPKGDLHRLKEAKAAFLTHGMYGDIVKSTIALYMAEFLYRVVRESEPQPLLFDYIVGCIKSLDAMSDKAAANFHLYFTINIAGFLGFYPENEYFEDSFFDIALSKFVVIKPLHSHYITAEGSKLLGSLLKINLNDLDELQLNREKRRYLLQSLITFFGYHHDTVYKIESVKILSEVF